MNKIESAKTSADGEKLYEILLNHYSLVKERNDLFVQRSQNLLGFAGIINTILVALLMTIIINDETREVLASSAHFNFIYLFIVIGFLGYILAIILALFAFKITKYKPVPQINSKEYIIKVFQGEVFLSLKHFSIQIYEAIEFYNKKNAEKYMYLFLATVSLMIAIISTAILGILILTFI